MRDLINIFGVLRSACPWRTVPDSEVQQKGFVGIAGLYTANGVLVSSASKAVKSGPKKSSKAMKPCSNRA